MKERPILFSGPMVKAILDGRKTQTRRVIKPQPNVSERHAQILPEAWDAGFIDVKCPYGRRGDRLWVREAIRIIKDEGTPEPGGTTGCEIQYLADLSTQSFSTGDVLYHASSRCRPSIHMPRWASRITLEITNVRVERIKDCSEADARAEGPEPNWSGPLNKGPAGTVSAAGWDPERDGYMDIEDQHYPEGCECGNGLTGREAFEKRWNAINAKRGFGWEKNPWVWVIEFKRVEVAQ